MFSTISSLAGVAGDPIIITDEESMYGTHLDLCESVPRHISRVSREKNGDSLLSVLDDKNKTISSLTKQLQNQKMQLTYYIKRDLSQNKIREFSESCTPQASEESLPLNLAINKFCRQWGIKTKLLLLHERMNRLDCKISNSLKDQEFVLRRIINKLCDFVKLQEISKSDFKGQFGRFISDPLHIDLFDKLLASTLSLRRKMDGFKICCERVLLIEEERNAIVEQVYSLPVEERINCNYLLRIQMEKLQLENEIKRISRHNATSRHRIKELNVIENILHNLQWELNSSFLKNEENCITKMLKKINSEAQVLLETTKEQKRKFECELSKTKCPEPNRVLFFINLAASGGDYFAQKDFDLYGIKSEEEIRFFEMVKGEIDLLKRQMKEQADKDVTEVKTECDLLKGKVSQYFLDNTRAKIANKSLQEELEEATKLKLQHKDGLRTLKEERDAYKSQVEDLQAIREAYAQLVDKQPNRLQMEREFMQQIDERDSRIFDLEKIVDAQNQEIEGLKANITDQRDQIIVLNRFINLTRPNSPRCYDPDNEIDFNVRESSSHLLSGILGKSTKEEGKSRKSNVPFPRHRRYSIETKTCSKESLKHNCSSPSKRKISTQSSKYYYDIQKVVSTSFETLSPSGQESVNSIFQHKNREVTQAEVKTRDDIKGNVKMEKSSVFSVEIKYQNSKIDNTLFELDEYEIFKDVSRESVVLENRFAKISRPMRYNN